MSSAIVETPKLERWMSLSEVAEAIGVTQSTVSKYVAQGLLPIRLRYNVKYYSVPSVMDFEPIGQGKRPSGGSKGLSDPHGTEAYRKLRDEFSDPAEDVLFVPQPTDGEVQVSVFIKAGEKWVERKRVAFSIDGKMTVLSGGGKS